MRNGFNANAASSAYSVTDFCATPRTREEIAAFVGKSQNHVMSHIVTPLVASGELRLTIPEKPKSSKQRFVAS